MVAPSLCWIVGAPTRCRTESEHQDVESMCTNGMYIHLKENFGRDKAEEWHGIEAEKEQISHDEGGYKHSGISIISYWIVIISKSSIQSPSKSIPYQIQIWIISSPSILSSLSAHMPLKQQARQKSAHFQVLVWQTRPGLVQKRLESTAQDTSYREEFNKLKGLLESFWDRKRKPSHPKLEWPRI